MMRHVIPVLWNSRPVACRFRIRRSGGNGWNLRIVLACRQSAALLNLATDGAEDSGQEINQGKSQQHFVGEKQMPANSKAIRRMFREAIRPRNPKFLKLPYRAVLIIMIPNQCQSDQAEVKSM